MTRRYFTRIRTSGLQSVADVEVEMDGVGGLELAEGAEGITSAGSFAGADGNPDGTPERLASAERPEEVERSLLSTVMHQRLSAYARRYLRDADEAEDIAQETLLRAREGLDMLRDPGRLEAWLFRICRHAAIDRVRARRVRQGLWVSLSDDLDGRPAGPGGAGADAGVDADADRADGAGRLRVLAPEFPAGQRALLAAGWARLELPAQQKLLVRLHYERGWSQARLCRLFGLSPSALRVRLFRARNSLARRAAG